MPVAQIEHIIAGQRVHERGAGRPIILIHGVGMDLAMWDRTADLLARRFRVVSYDMIGHGPSRQPDPPYTLSTYVAQLSLVLDALGIDRCGVVGFSMGSLVGQGFALANPDRVEWLVSLNGVYNRSPEERAAVLARVAAAEHQGAGAGLDAAIERWFTPTFREENPDVILAVRRQLLGNDKRAFAGAYQVFGTADAELADRISDIRCPTLVMTGEFDQRSTAAMAEAVAARVPNSECLILASQRHLTPLEAPGEIASQIEDFLRRHSLAT